MMISPEFFARQWKDLSYPKLIRERDRLIRFLQDFEKKEVAGDRSDPAWNCSPSPEVQYQVYLDYLAAICGIMHDQYNEEYVWGQRILKDDYEKEKEKGEAKQGFPVQRCREGSESQGCEY